MAPRDTAAQPSAPADQRAEGDDSTRHGADITALQASAEKLL